MKIVQISKDPNNISISEPYGGKLGTAPILCEGIDAEIVFDGLGDKLMCHALDPDGNRMIEVPVKKNDNGDAVLRIAPEYKTVWYEISITQ